MATIDDLEPSARRFIERYPFPRLSAPVLTPLRKKLSEAKIALITTAGLHLKSDPPFNDSFWSSDCSYRLIPANTRACDLAISHTSREFERSGALKDLNVVFPEDRLNELIAMGKLASLSTNHFSFMGSLPRTGELRKRRAPEVAKLLRKDDVDLVLLIPV
ncbi:MAG: hypothetical protein K8F91_00085 [Candidatus Obscuribacterales bacterium]|nr:hypothetical protein [Candidatus Obscuribacterales bacterium]